jgi:hypothetical protein
MDRPGIPAWARHLPRGAVKETEPMSRTFTLTADQRAQFERTGLLRLPGFFPRAVVDPMAGALWTDLAARFGMRSDDRRTWTVTRPMHFQTVVASGAFDALGTPSLRAVADQLLGAGGWEEPYRWAQPLVTFPTSSSGTGHVAWHFDLPGSGRPWPLPVLRLFTFLEPVAAHGGGTFCLSGSAALVARNAPGPVASNCLRLRVNARYPWIASLCAAAGDGPRDHLGETVEIEGCALEVVELTGQPGDAVLMHPLTLHAGARNALDRPRMMLASSILALSERKRKAL